MLGFLKRFLGDNNDKEIARYREVVEKINALEPQMQNLTDDKLTGYTNKFRERLAAGETMDDLLPEAFAVVREASRRVLGMRHFDVQLIGGMCLHEGKIAEMRTGEGKTLVATLPVYLNALAGKGVHMITVNDYLARRDSEEMGKLYRYLGLTVGLVIWTSLSASMPMAVMLPSVRITSLVSITCAITWLSIRTRWFSVNLTLLSSMRLTPS